MSAVANTSTDPAIEAPALWGPPVNSACSLKLDTNMATCNKGGQTRNSINFLQTLAATLALTRALQTHSSDSNAGKSFLQFRRLAQSTAMLKPAVLRAYLGCRLKHNRRMQQAAVQCLRENASGGPR